MSRSYKKYPIYRTGYGYKFFKKIANKKVRVSKEVKNNGHYKKFFSDHAYYLKGLVYQKDEYLQTYSDTMLPDELYKDWVTHYYFK